MLQNNSRRTTTTMRAISLILKTAIDSITAILDLAVRPSSRVAVLPSRLSMDQDLDSDGNISPQEALCTAAQDLGCTMALTLPGETDHGCIMIASILWTVIRDGDLQWMHILAADAQIAQERGQEAWRGGNARDLEVLVEIGRGVPGLGEARQKAVEVEKGAGRAEGDRMIMMGRGGETQSLTQEEGKTEELRSLEIGDARKGPGAGSEAHRGAEEGMIRTAPTDPGDVRIGAELRGVVVGDKTRDSQRRGNEVFC